MKPLVERSDEVQARLWRLIAAAWMVVALLGAVAAIEALQLHHLLTMFFACACIGASLTSIGTAIKALSGLKAFSNFDLGGRRVGWFRRSVEDDHRGADSGPVEAAAAGGNAERADDCAEPGEGAREGASVTIEASTAPDLTTCVLGFRQWTFSYVLDPDAQPPQMVSSNGVVTQTVEPTYYLVDGERVPTLLGSSQQHWHAGVNRARCHVNLHWSPFGGLSGKPTPPPAPHLPPGSECGCGLYGLHDGEAFISKGYNSASILGAISAWGRMEVHKDGFRAEFARVIMLAYDPAHGIAIERRVRKTAEVLNVPCVPIDELPMAALEYAQPVPVELRGRTEVTSHAGGASRRAELEAM